MFGIWTTIAGGVTGSRSAWLKENGKQIRFDTIKEAENEAERLYRKYPSTRWRHAIRETRLLSVLSRRTPVRVFRLGMH